MRAARGTMRLPWRVDALSRETLGYAADFLDRPTDEIGSFGVALDLVFLGAGLLA